jgi:HEAT repeat protein
VSWHPAVALFVIFDVSLLVGIAIASLPGRSPWNRRRTVRSSFDSTRSVDQLRRALFRRRSPLLPQLLVRELSRRVRTPASQPRARALVEQLHTVIGAVLNEALTPGPAGSAATRRVRVGVRLLGRLPSPELVPPVIALLERNDEQLLIDLLTSIAQSPAQYPSALVVLPRLMNDSRPRVKLLAAWACVRILRTRPETWPLLQGDTSPEVRTAIVRAATLRAGDSAVVPADARDVVLRAASDPARQVRLAGTVALSRFRSDRAIQEAAYRALRDPQLDIRIAAAAAISPAVSAPDAAQIAGILARTDDRTVDALLAHLSTSRESSWTHVVPIAADTRSPYRRAAIRLLGTDVHPRAQAALAGFLEDDDPSIRIESAVASARVARLAFPKRLEQALAQRLLAVLERSSEAPLLLHVVDALACSGHPDVPGALVARIPASAGPIRERLVDASALFDHLSRWVEGRTRHALMA